MSSTELKVTGNRTTYKPVELTDQSVYDHVRHYYTLDELAELFNVSKNTILEHHGEAFRAGKRDAMQKPRMLLAKIFEDFSHVDLNFARSDVPVNVLLKAIEVHARKYEGYGSEQKVTIQDERPSVSDIVFAPMGKDD